MKSKPKWNWLKWLDRAIKKAPSLGEWDEACLRAQDWPTCACGELCGKLPRSMGGRPIDDRLVILGAEFSAWIRGRHWRSARNTFFRIEARTAELLKR